MSGAQFCFTARCWQSVFSAKVGKLLFQIIKAAGNGCIQLYIQFRPLIHLHLLLYNRYSIGWLKFWLRIKFKPHKNKRLPAASCTETSWIATIFLKSDRFIQPDSRCVLCYDLQLYLQVSRLLRAFDARKRKSLPDAATPVGFFNSDAKVCTVASLFLVANRFKARCSGDPAVNERGNLDGIFAFATCLISREVSAGGQPVSVAGVVVVGAAVGVDVTEVVGVA